MSHSGQGVKSKTRGKVKAELWLLGLRHPAAVCPSHTPRAHFLWGVPFRRLEAPWPASLLH